jgi:large subunit ribosomal protein L29
VRAKDMRERNDEELAKLLNDTKDNLFRLRLKNATHQLENTGDIKKNRREIARILTIMNERAGNSSAAVKRDEE